MSGQNDDELWAEQLRAEQEFAHKRAEFYQNAQDRVRILRSALRGGPVAACQAVRFLEALPTDAIELIPELVSWSGSPRCGLKARQALAAIPRDQLMNVLRPLLAMRIETADCDDYGDYMQLLAHLEEWSMLGQIVSRATFSDDQELRDIADVFRARYEPLWNKLSGTLE